MSGSEPDAQLLAHVRLEHTLAVVELLWPCALTACVGVLRWRSLRSKAGFIVAGVLGSFGLQAFLARLARYLFWTYFAPLEPNSYSVVLHVTDPLVIVVVSAALSIPLLLWLADLVGIPPAADDRRRAREGQ